MKVDIKIEEIQEFLPHRYPMLLVDRVIEMELADYIVAYKNITTNEPYLIGHFPGKQIMPGVLIVEAMAQASGILGFKTMDKKPEDGSIYYFVGADDLRFKRPAVPGDQLIISCELLSIKRQRFGKVKGEAHVDGNLVCAGELMFSLVD